MDLKEQFKKEKGYDAYAYDNNKQGEPRVIGYCENYAEWLEGKIRKLQHHKDTTSGLWATDKPEMLNDPNQYLFQIA